MRASKFLLAALLGVVVLLAIAAGIHYRLFERGWFHLGQWHQAEQRQASSLWLPDYRATIQGKVVRGIDDDLSALTFDPDRNSLIAVTNGNPHWLELSLEGDLLRAIPLVGFGDPEAIEYISEGVYVISDERLQRLLRIQVDEQTTVIDAAHASQLSLGIDRNGNKGFEGLAYDTAGKRLFVAKERNPVRIYEISGFPYAEPTLSVQISEHEARLFVRDLSSLQFDERSGHLLALSDESRLVVELDTSGRPLSSLLLKRGQHGLEADVPQPEGLAMAMDGTLYLVSEPNLFYVFRK
ncbi:SdiA-regulated domain-containing protein [Stutzerimonas stutzeri]|uniref:SdiA-regulated domain-containing protein n=1 Tax=Stutzerimonas sp. S1 TaxID=3030652 RepID=UPI0022254616|nr:SdiA-regulated domain-containing protein [Stutzerimonas sp. S1]MCW3149387.1 SdiA-regulated domain-containing protein [Stutzerimonas sp. S1]